jgi:hypothetical protein
MLERFNEEVGALSQQFQGDFLPTTSERLSRIEKQLEQVLWMLRRIDRPEQARWELVPGLGHGRLL